MDILLSTFVKKHINRFDENLLKELDKFLDFDDEIILDFYQYNKTRNKINENKISETFKKFKI